MIYLLPNNELYKILIEAETIFLNSEKFKFQRSNSWRKSIVPNFPGVYALFEKKETDFILIYVGETGNLRDRMDDICRTVNHTFRRQLGHKRYNAEKPKKKKFTEETETILDAFMDDHLYVSFLQVNFGRTEIEDYLVSKYQAQLFNSETKRKLKLEIQK